MPALIQDGCDLNFRVRVQKLIDGGDDVGGRLTHHPGWKCDGYRQRACGATTQTHVRGDDISPNQGDVFDEQTHDAFALARLDRGIVPDPREIVDQRQQLLSCMRIDEALIFLGLLLVVLLSGEVNAQLIVPLCLQTVDNEAIVRVRLHVSATCQLRLIAGTFQLSAA